MVVALMSLLALEVTAAPAYAGKTATATISSDVGCDADQELTGVRITLTEIPKWQKVTVNTDAYQITRDHERWERTNAEASTGTGYYDVAIEGRLNRNSPATAWISNNAWGGSFQVTSVSCRDLERPVPTTPATTNPVTQQPTTTAPTTEATTLPTSTTAPGNPAFPVFPGTTTNPTVLPSASGSPSTSSSTSPSHRSSASASPHASSASPSPTAITLTSDDETDTSAISSYVEKALPEGVAQAVKFEGVSTATSAGIWLFVLLALATAFWFVARRLKRKRV
jgi:hypothetical protein